MISDLLVTRRMSCHLGLPTELPELAPARTPPRWFSAYGRRSPSPLTGRLPRACSHWWVGRPPGTTSGTPAARDWSGLGAPGHEHPPGDCMRSGPATRCWSSLSPREGSERRGTHEAHGREACGRVVPRLLMAPLLLQSLQPVRLVGMPGIEPGRPEGLRILSPMRLPISPHPRRPMVLDLARHSAILVPLQDGGVAKW